MGCLPLVVTEIKIPPLPPFQMPHKALWINSDATQEVKYIEGGYTPGEDELLLKCICVSVNPGDWKHAEAFGAVNRVAGYDAVGEIVKLGPGVTQFKPGQKVLTFVRIGPAPYGAAQEYFLTQASVSWLFDMPDEQAVTIPLTLCTAGDGLYNQMQLPLPGEEQCGVPILIWGASSQVGIQAIQCAKQSGCKPVIATASPKQHEYLKSLGADFVFDYKDPDVESKIKSASGNIRHAFDCVGVDESVLKILESIVAEGGIIVLALPSVRETPRHHSVMAVAGTINNLESFSTPNFKFVDGVDPPTSEQGADRLQKLVRWALTDKRYRVPRVRKLSGRGLCDALEAFELMKQGKISGEKVVYRMADTPEI